jgi:hypothetical protein
MNYRGHRAHRVPRWTPDVQTLLRGLSSVSLARISECGFERG